MKLGVTDAGRLQILQSWQDLSSQQDVDLARVLARSLAISQPVLPPDIDWPLITAVCKYACSIDTCMRTPADATDGIARDNSRTTKTRRSFIAVTIVVLQGALLPGATTLQTLGIDPRQSTIESAVGYDLFRVEKERSPSPAVADSRHG